MTNGILAGSVRPRSGRYLRSGMIALFVLATAGPSGRAEQVTGPQTFRSESEAILKFEVASIKPCKTEMGGRSGGSQRSSPGRLDLICTTLADLIHIAYDQNATNRPVNSSMADVLQPMKGGPSWIYNERYTVDAKAEGTPNRRTMMGPMLQALLEERFHLKVHQETEQVDMYALTPAKGGPKLQRLEEGGCTPLSTAKGGATPNQAPHCGTVRAGKSGTNSTLDVFGLSVAGFSRILRGFVDRPILDKTGLTGLYVFHLEYAPDEFAKGIYSGDDSPSGLSAAPTDPSSGQSIFGALQQQLGLRLEQTRGPHGFLVIDHVEGLSEN